MNKSIYLLTALLFLFNIACTGQQKHDNSDQATQIEVIKSEDEIIFDDFIHSIKDVPKDEFFLHTANYFLGKPYVGGTLEINETEQLVVNLREFDCVTFVESCMALTTTVLSEHISFETFKENLQKIRYRNGIIDGYNSRLHYTTDWVYNNSKTNIIFDKTKNLGGSPLSVNVHYISKHVELDPNVLASISASEKEINSRENTYYYIPKEEISSKSHLINPGDIICFTTYIGGLDVQHLGIAYRKEIDHLLGMIHASSLEKQVVVEKLTIQEYCNSNKNISGIIVLERR